MARHYHSEVTIIVGTSRAEAHPGNRVRVTINATRDGHQRTLPHISKELSFRSEGSCVSSENKLVSPVGVR